MRQLSVKRYRFPADIIRHSVWLYARFTLSYRDVEEMLAERGLDISYETVRRWFLKFGSTIAADLRRTRSRPSDHWHLDEMVIVIKCPSGDIASRMNRLAVAPSCSTGVACDSLGGTDSFREVRWSPNLRQVAKVDPTMRRTIHHENAQTVHG